LGWVGGTEEMWMNPPFFSPSLKVNYEKKQKTR